MGFQPITIDTAYLEGDEAKRLFWRGIAIAERIASSLLLLAVIPLLATAALATVILSRRSPLIAHCRVGQGGRPIWVLKLRTMWERNPASQRRVIIVERITAECTAGVEIKSRQDTRVTSRFAAMLRRYSIDELPQLWQVVRGEMALVGPRPLTATELAGHYGPAANEILKLRPGISGLWQINGRSRLTYVQRRRLDLFMVRNWSLKLYIGIVIRTIPTVLIGKNAW